MNLLVDLDGTITDPARGILGSVVYAIERMGLAPPPVETLGWLIGPPLRHSFPMLGVPADRVDEALGHYRERYGKGGGMYEAELIDGMEPALRQLRGQGHRLFVATSKPHFFARPLIAHFGLSDIFEAVHGAELDGRNDAKKDVIADILNTHHLAAADCIMIGDTPYDVEGAAHHAIPTIGVNWGHGDERLAASNPAVIIDRATDLPAAVARIMADSQRRAT